MYDILTNVFFVICYDTIYETFSWFQCIASVLICMTLGIAASRVEDLAFDVLCSSAWIFIVGHLPSSLFMHCFQVTQNTNHSGFVTSLWFKMADTSDCDCIVDVTNAPGIQI